MSTADIVDRERFPNGFNIIITCSDQGTKPLAASVNLFVNISDANDNSPVFSRYSYRGKVMENAIGAVAVAVNATDADTGPAGEILYVITGESCVYSCSIHSDSTQSRKYCETFSN